MVNRCSFCCSNSLVLSTVDPASTGGTVIPVSEPDHDSGLEDSCHSVPRVSAVVVPDGHWNRKEEEEKNDDEILQQLKPTGVAQHMDSRPASSELTRIMFELNQKVGALLTKDKISMHCCLLLLCLASTKAFEEEDINKWRWSFWKKKGSERCSSL